MASIFGPFSIKNVIKIDAKIDAENVWKIDGKVIEKGCRISPKIHDFRMFSQSADYVKTMVLLQ